MNSGSSVILSRADGEESHAAYLEILRCAQDDTSSLLDCSRTQLGDEPNEPAAFHVGCFPCLAKRFELLLVFVRCDGESVERLRRRVAQLARPCRAFETIGDVAGRAG